MPDCHNHVPRRLQPWRSPQYNDCCNTGGSHMDCNACHRQYHGKKTDGRPFGKIDADLDLQRSKIMEGPSPRILEKGAIKRSPLPGSIRTDFLKHCVITPADTS